MLPYSRNRTYGPGTPVASVDLNDLQDCVVDDKHPELEIGLSAAAYTPNTGAGPALTDNTYWSGAVNIKYNAPLLVPVGKRITTFRQYYEILVGGALSAKVRRIALATGVTTDAPGGASQNDATNGGIESFLFTMNHVAEAGYAYFVEVFPVASDTRVHGGILKYDSP